MIKFTRHIALAFFITFGSAFVLNKAIFRFFFSYHKRTQLDISGLNKQVVFFGSSRCIHHVNPNIIDSICHTSSYNMGWAAANPREIYAAIKIYLSRNNAPGLICIQIDQEHDDTTEDLLARQSLLKFYDQHIIDDYFSPDLKSELKIPLLASIKYRDFGWREILKTIFKNSSLANTNLGFKPLSPQKFAGNINAIVSNSQLNIANPYLTKIINICTRKKIKVLLFTSPLYNLGQSKNFNKLSNLYNVQYLNFADSIQNQNMYHDQTHLNAMGADKFSKMLTGNISKLLSIP